LKEEIKLFEKQSKDAEVQIEKYQAELSKPVE
jgi:hypothetical protein